MTVTADKIIRLKTVLDRTGLSRSTVYRKINEGTFPRQIQISIHGAGWRNVPVDIFETSTICTVFQVRLT